MFRVEWRNENEIDLRHYIRIVLYLIIGFIGYKNCSSRLVRLIVR